MPESNSTKENKTQTQMIFIKVASKVFKCICKWRKNTNEKFRNYFEHQNPSSLVKDLIKADKNKSDKIKTSDY